MTNEIATVRPAGAMADIVPTGELRTLIASLGNSLERVDHRNDVIDRLPTPIEKSKLKERLFAISSVLQPSSQSVGAQKRVGVAIAELLGGFPNLRGLDPAATIAGYTMALQDLPGWAVVQVCAEFKEGRAFEVIDGKEKRLSPDFAPSAPRIHMLARAKLDALHAEDMLIRRVMEAKLAAPVTPPEQLERVSAMMKDHAAGWADRVAAEEAAEHAKVKQESQEARERAARFLREGNARRLAAYHEAGLRPVYTNDGLNVVEITLLQPIERVPVERIDWSEQERE